MEPRRFIEISVILTFILGSVLIYYISQSKNNMNTIESYQENCTLKFIGNCTLVCENTFHHYQNATNASVMKSELFPSMYLITDGNCKVYSPI